MQTMAPPSTQLRAPGPQQSSRQFLPRLKQQHPAQLRSVAAQARRARTAGSLASTNGHDPEKSAKMDLLERAISEVCGRYGKGSIMRQGDKPLETIQRIPSGCLALDAALGGGYPRGRIVEVYGPESCGKTTLALHAIAEVQKQGGSAIIVDVEQALDLEHARRLGVDVESLIAAQPTYGEEALDIVDVMAASGAVDLVVVDSVSALVPRAELEGDIGQAQVGIQARLMSQALRKLIGTANKGNCTIMFINQLRQKVGVMYGNPETTSGGNALKYYSSVRVDLRKKEAIKSGEEATGIRVKAKVVKNKTAPPLREAMFDILFACGIDSVGSVVDAAELVGVVQRKGSWYYMGDRKLGQGREKVVESLRTDPALLKEVSDATQEAFSSSPDALLGLGDELGPESLEEGPGALPVGAGDGPDEE